MSRVESLTKPRLPTFLLQFPKLESSSTPDYLWHGFSNSEQALAETMPLADVHARLTWVYRSLVTTAEN